MVNVIPLDKGDGDIAPVAVLPEGKSEDRTSAPVSAHREIRIWDSSFRFLPTLCLLRLILVDLAVNRFVLALIHVQHGVKFGKPC